MPFDTKKWNSLAKQGDVAGIAIYTSLAIRNLNLALRAIRANDDPEEYLADASKMADELWAIYRDMTGYQPDGE